MKKNTVHAYLGRFCPFHKGHQKTVEILIEKYGRENVVVIIGSSTSYNERTPYTFEDREKMIHTVYPDIKIYLLPDPEPALEFFRNDTNSLWLKSVSDLEKKLGVNFVFVGGSTNDLKILSEKFATEIVLPRNGFKEDISATKIREALKNKKFDFVREMVDPKVFDITVSGFQRFTSNSF